MKGKAKPLPTQEYLKQCFDYNPETGKLTWRDRPPDHFRTKAGWMYFQSRYPGKLALNYLTEGGYYRGILNGQSLMAHRVIYKLIHGVDPADVLHEDGNTVDNRIEKLSNDSHLKNSLDMKKSKKNKSGCTGVHQDSKSRKWVVQISNKGKRLYLGYFDNIEDAIATRKNAELEYGYHPNHGKR